MKTKQKNGRGRASLIALLVLVLCAALLAVLPFMAGAAEAEPIDPGTGVDPEAGATIHLHHECGKNAPDCTDDSHSIATFKAISPAEAMPTEAGRYYLDGDITLTSSWVIESDIVLCLNGHKLSRAHNDDDNYFTLIKINSGASLTLCDCSADATGIIENATYITLFPKNGAIYNEGTFNMYGGTITESRVMYGGGVYNKGLFNMYGGSITGNSADYGGGVYNMSTFRMYGGSITGNTADEGGGVYNNIGSTIYLYSGKITGNTHRTDDTANNLYCSNYDTAIVMPGFTGNVGITLNDHTHLTFSVGGAAAVDCFTSDSANYVVEAVGENLVLAPRINETNFPDATFREYIVTNCDLNTDGFLSAEEIANVTSLSPDHFIIITSLEGIQYFTELTYLDCSYNRLTSLDISNNKMLTELYCNQNQLKNLDVSNNTQLTYLNCSYNQLTSLDVSQNTLLETLDVKYNQLTHLDCSMLTNLSVFNGGGQTLVAIKIAENADCPMPAGFVLANATVTGGGAIRGGAMKADEGTDTLTYNYAVGVGDNKLSVTLTIFNPHEHNYVEFKCIDCGHDACTHGNGSINYITGVCATCNKQFAVSVIGNGIHYFDSFAEALAKAKELFEAHGFKNTIQLYTDLTVSEPVTFAGSKLGLTLNGKTLTFTSNGGACWTIDNATVFISDTNGGKIYFNMGDTSGDGGIVLTNGATLEINNGTFETSVGPAFYIVKGAITQSGGVVKNHIKIQEGDYTLVDGTIELRTEYVFYIQSNGGIYTNKITISGGRITASDLIKNDTSDTSVATTISGGEFAEIGWRFGIVLKNSDSVSITGGTFETGISMPNATLADALAPEHFFSNANGEPIILTEGQTSITEKVTVEKCTHSDPSYTIEDNFSQKHIVLCIVCGFKEEADCTYQSDCEEWCSVCFFMTRDIPIEMHSLNYIVTDSIPTGQHNITCENCKFSEIANCTYAQDCSVVCKDCNATITPKAEHTPANTSNGNGTHDVVCTVCAYVITDNVDCSAHDADNNAVCDLCGAVTYAGAGTEADPYVVTTAAELNAALFATVNETNYIVFGSIVPYNSKFSYIKITSDSKPFVLDLNQKVLNTDMYIFCNGTIKNGIINYMSIQEEAEVCIKNITSYMQITASNNSILTVRDSALQLLVSNDSATIIADNVTISNESGYAYLYECNGGSLILDGVTYTENITDEHYPHTGNITYTPNKGEDNIENGTHTITWSCCDKEVTENCTNADCTAESECVCGHTMAATQTAHDFSGEYTYNESYHWKKCKNCEEIAEYHWHSNNGNVDCEQDSVCYCGYVIEEAKGHDFTFFTGDETHHYTACHRCMKPLESTKVPHNITGKGYSEEYHYDICADCTVEVINKEEHTLTHYENAEKHWSECSVCQGTVGEYDHYFEVKSDETHHWYECYGEYCTAEKGYGEHNANGGLYCEVCEELLLDGKVSQVSLTLDGDIGVNFYWLLSYRVLESNDAYFLITLPNGETEQVAVSYDLVASPVNVNDGETYFKVTGRVAAKEMAEKIKVELYFGGVSVASGECSVRDYAQLVFDNAPDNRELVDMMKAMLNYGAASQMLFGHNTGDLANKNLAEADRVVSEVSATLNPVLVSGSVPGIKTEEFSVILETKTTIRHYFSLTGEAKIEDYSFGIGDASAVPTEIVKDGKTMYYVDITDISAKDMATTYTFIISKAKETGEGNDIMFIRASVHSYINAVIKNKDNTALVSPELLATANAMHAYGEAAKTYFATLNG